MNKWEKYYHDESPPPWESPFPFQGLVELGRTRPDLFNKKGTSAIELGSGTSASAVWLAEQGLETTAVDLCTYFSCKYLMCTFVFSTFDHGVGMYCMIISFQTSN